MVANFRNFVNYSFSPAVEFINYVISSLIQNTELVFGIL